MLATAVGLVSQVILKLPGLIRWREIVKHERHLIQKWKTENQMASLSTATVPFLKTLPVTYDLQLTPRQNQLMYEAVTAFLACYGQSDFEGFRSYRLRYPHELDTLKLERIRQGLEKTQKIKIPEKDPEALVERFWRILLGNTHLSEFSSNNTRFYVTVVLDRSHMPNEDSLRILLPGAAVIHKLNTVLIHPTPEELLAQKRPVTVFVFQTFFKYKGGPEAPSPFHIVFYWSDAHQNWIPWDIGLLTAGKYPGFL